MIRGSVCSADGTEIVWRTWGDGPGVVVVHGSLEDGTAWSGVAERRALPQATVVELPGVGHEAHLLAPDLLAEHLASFLA